MSIKVDLSKQTGTVKPMHGVGQPPFSGTDFSMFHYLKEAGIPFSRLHDVGGSFGGGLYVDIPNLFRNFDADAEDPASYDFTFTDMLITALMENKVEPFFRLGVTIENHARFKSYTIDPPKDYNKWAVICEKVIRHYTEGWADGYTYNIRYWEIWNEPENSHDPRLNEMWTGTKEQYYKLYDTAAKHLKACFPHLKIGGYASCGFYALKGGNSPREAYFMDFFHGFLDYIRASGAPLDFFSWHSYDSIPVTMMFADYARKKLDEAGFTETETTCNEWNCEVGTRGTARHAALTCGMMLAMQNSPLDSAMFYDAQFGTSIYGSLFNPLTAEPFPSYYTFIAFNDLYRRGSQAEVLCDIPGVYAAAAKGEDGCIVIANTNTEDVSLDLEMNGTVTGCRVIDKEHNLCEIDLPDVLAAETVLCITVKTA